ncbi:MAG: hypothetical protein ACO1TE_27530 [Prosthecobacter sp.]
MNQLTPAVLEEAVSLIHQLRSHRLDEAAISEAGVRLNALLPDPCWFDYTMDHVPELPAEDAVRRAFEYRPIILGGPPDSSPLCND